MFEVKRWCFTTWAVFMLYPRGYSLAASVQDKWLNYNKIVQYFNVHSKPLSPKPSLNIGRTKDPASTLAEAEPGFDFSDEEMKKLKIWPGGVIPYYIDEFSFDKVFRDRIRNFLDLTNGATGLNFLELHRPPGDDETRWVLFVNRQSLLNCVDHPLKNFTSEGVQKVLLGYDCLNDDKELAATVLALVGIPPQHNAPNRYEYIDIIKSNIMPGKEYLFEILSNNEWLFHDIDYDFNSAGHYDLHKYTSNGMATISPLEYVKLSDEKGFSYTDIWKIRMLYNYISKKRRESIGVPQCKKLFDLGTSFSSNVHKLENDVQPRKKPNKYLGLPEEESLTDSGDVNNNNNNTNTTDADNDANKVQNSNKTNSDNELDGENQKSSNSQEISNVKNVTASKDTTENINQENVTRESSEQLQNHGDNVEIVGKPPQGMRFTRPGKGYTKKTIVNYII